MLAQHWRVSSGQRLTSVSERGAASSRPPPRPPACLRLYVEACRPPLTLQTYMLAAIPHLQTEGEQHSDRFKCVALAGATVTLPSA